MNRKLFTDFQKAKLISPDMNMAGSEHIVRCNFYGALFLAINTVLVRRVTLRTEEGKGREGKARLVGGTMPVKAGRVRSQALVKCFHMFAQETSYHPHHQSHRPGQGIKGESGFTVVEEKPSGRQPSSGAMRKV